MNNHLIEGKKEILRNKVMKNKCKIIYAFYGMGKTTYCNKHKDCFDADYEYFRFSKESEFYTYEEYVRELSQKYKIVFVNKLIDNIDYAIMPSDYESTKQRIIARKQGNFIPSKEEYDSIINKCKKIKFTDKYIADVIKERKIVMDELKRKERQLEKLLSETSTLEQEIKAIKEQRQQEEESKYTAICLDALIVGTYGMKVKNGSIAPYSTGNYVTPNYENGKNPDNPVKKSFCASVSSSGNWIETLPKELYKYLKNIGWTNKEFNKLKADTDKLWDELPTAYTPDFYKKPANSWDRGYIANGYETDGFDNIIKGYCEGDYSSYTTNEQNSISRDLILLKGYCIDYCFKNLRSIDTNNKEIMSDVKINNNRISLQQIKEIWDRHGLDTDFTNMEEWYKRNPTRLMPNNEYYISKEDYESDIELD